MQRGSAEYNMAVDEALLSHFGAEDRPILRLYRWEPALSLGRFSDIMQTVELQALHNTELPIVRRMTGGGILIHGGELSYTLIVPRHSLKALGVKESYRHLCGFLITLYAKLGLQADFAHEVGVKSSKSAICMNGYEPYDIIIGGQKVGGNAQRYTREALFQHGTIPMKVLAKLGSETKTITSDELSTVLLEAITQSFGIEIIADKLHPAEEESTARLLRDKYTQERWNIDAKQDRGNREVYITERKSTLQ